MTPMIALEWVGVAAVALLAMGLAASVIAAAVQRVREALRPNPFKACTRTDHECGKAGAGPCNGLPRIDWSQPYMAAPVPVSQMPPPPESFTRPAESLPKRSPGRKIVIRPSDPEGN